MTIVFAHKCDFIFLLQLQDTSAEVDIYLQVVTGELHTPLDRSTYVFVVEQLAVAAKKIMCMKISIKDMYDTSIFEDTQHLYVQLVLFIKAFNQLEYEATTHTYYVYRASDSSDDAHVKGGAQSPSSSNYWRHRIGG